MWLLAVAEVQEQMTDEDRTKASENNVILKRMEAQLTSVIITVHGEAETNIDGVIERSGGLEDRVDNLEKEAKTERLRLPDRVALYIAAMGAVAYVVAAIASVV